MAIITNNYRLSLSQNDRDMLRIRCSQNDSGVQINFTLYNNGEIFTIPSGLSVAVNGVKSNGVVFSKNCTISSNKVILTLSSNITDVVGVTIAEVVLTNSDGDRVGSSNFVILIEPNPLLRGKFSESTVSPAEYISNFIDVLETLNARVNNIITPTGDASLSEVVDARYSGYSGKTFTSLKSRVDGDFEIVESILKNISDDVGVNTLINWVSGYYRLDGEQTGITTDTIVDAANYICMYDVCEEGDIYLYSGKGTSAARRYAFLSDDTGDNNIIAISSSSTGLMSNYIVVAPKDAKYIIINTDKRVYYNVVKIKKRKYIAENSDLDDYMSAGTYYCSTSSIAATLTNLPVGLGNISFCLIVLETKELNSSVNVLQILIRNSNLLSTMYKRIYIDSSPNEWSDWHKIYESGQDTLLEIKNLVQLPVGADLDDVKDYGSYYCQNASDAKTIKNLPFFVDSGFSLYVVNSHKESTDEKYIRQIIFGNKISLSSIYTRALNIEWGEWQLLINAGIYEQPKIVEASNFVYIRPVGVVKKTINVATNNVAHYWCQGRDFSDDVQRYLADVPIRIARWKRWLLHVNIDVLFLQECEDYVDHGYSGHAKTMKAFDYLYAPFFNSDDEIEVVTTGSVLPENRIDTQTDSTNPARRKILDRLGLQIVIHENENHEPEEQKGCVIVDALSTSHYTGKGYYNWRIVQFEGVGKILLINVHNFAGLDSIVTYYERRLDRKKLLDELESLIYSKRIEVGFDYFIIAGDFNSKLAKSNLSQADINTMNFNYPNWKDDREYILEFCNHISGIPVNGGMLGWFTTISQEESGNAYDNIIVSNNIRIEDIQCDPVLVPAGYLHTDHTPVVTKISFME